MHAAAFSEALINISDQQYRQLICRFISRAPDAPAIITDRGIADTSKFSIFIDMPEKTRKNSDYKKYMWHCINATQFIISSSSSDCFLCVPTQHLTTFCLYIVISGRSVRYFSTSVFYIHITELNS